MCIIVHKPAGIDLTEAVHNNCFDSNSDGGGFCYAEGGQIHTQKGFFEPEEMWAAVKDHLHRDLLLHYRIATHGTVNQFNCHPWPIQAGKRSFALAHNGILDWTSTAEMSDTGHYAMDVLQPLLEANPDAFDCPAVVGLFERDIGPGNKFVLLRDDGRTWRINAKAGVEDMGCWFSNTGYKEDRWPKWGKHDDDEYYAGQWPHKKSEAGAAAQKELLAKWQEQNKAANRQPDYDDIEYYDPRLSEYSEEDVATWRLQEARHPNTDDAYNLMAAADEYCVATIGYTATMDMWPDDRMAAFIDTVQESQPDLQGFARYIVIDHIIDNVADAVRQAVVFYTNTQQHQNNKAQPTAKQEIK